jgi:Na+/melibiose symporter-like transporter
MFSRQKITGWVLIVVSGGWLALFLKTRLLTAGVPIEKKEWVYFISMLVLLVIGTINVRMAAMRARRGKPNA